MKKSFRLELGIPALFLLAILSCHKPPSPSGNPITPLQTLVNTDTSMSFFHRLVLEANESGLLADDSVTLLIPTNDAFRSAGYLTDSVGSANADRLVRFHVIRSRVIPGSAAYSGYATFLGYSIYGMRDNTPATWFNGIAVSGDALQVGKALVYRLSAPLSPPADSLSLLLAQDSSLGFFAAVLQRTGLDTTLAMGDYTLLAPTNSAWIAAGYDSLGAIDSADLTTLTQLAKNQVVAGSWFTNTLAGLPTVTTLPGNTIAISVSGGNITLSGSGNPVPAVLLNGNRQSGNNLILHRTSQVLR